MSKIMSLTDAVSRIKNNDTILASGFLQAGVPVQLVDEILKQGQKNLSIVHNSGNSPDFALGKLIAGGMVRKLTASWCGNLTILPKMIENNEIELELCPQGSLVERIRAGGYGLGGILTPTGLNTIVEEKWGERVHLNGKDWIYQTPIRGNVAIIEADRADEAGNLIFALTQRNFSTVMCFAADFVIVEVINPIEKVGSFNPSEIHVTGAVINALVEHKR